MKNKVRASLVGVGALGMALAMPGVAFAQGAGGSTTYTANLQPVPLNTPAGAAGGTLELVLTGDQAQITEQVHGLGATFDSAPFPHVQHIHGGAAGLCPTAAADTNHDGVISTIESLKGYGSIQTTLSVSGSTAPSAGTDVKIAPSGSGFSYSRTITLSQAALTSLHKGVAVIVVHGLNPSNAPAASLKEKSALVASLPLAATAPALCGRLVVAQTGAVPAGAPQTGGGSTAGTQDAGLFGVGGALLLGGLGALAYRRRRPAA